jgi:enoyl-CoA hydratase/carnithine racemase
MRRCAELMRGLAEGPKPVVAAVEGVATAAGCQFVAACDLAIAGENARFALPGVNNGFFCSTPLVAVGRAVSRKAAMELALTGDLIDARRAETIGLVNRVVAKGRALAEAQALAGKIASRSRPVIALGKRVFQRQIETTLGDAYRIASEAMIENLGFADADEGISAFLEKRAPKWSAP